MSIFKLPGQVAKILEKMMRAFLWDVQEVGRVKSLVALEIIMSKRNGGLGLGNLKKKNVALLDKWLWRFPLEQQSLWAKIIKSKYGIQSNGWDSNVIRGSFRNPWKFISGLSVFPNVFIADILSIDTNNELGWDLGFRRGHNNREAEEMQSLLLRINSFSPNGSMPDHRVWLCDSSGFSCKSFLSLVENPETPKFEPLKEKSSFGTVSLMVCSLREQRRNIRSHVASLQSGEYLMENIAKGSGILVGLSSALSIVDGGGHHGIEFQ
ncbi:hypothetical protein TIFTF001_031795 [Ficus carica]|uniref:Uncharacterized protein n=1 Tax=Ficus carica TaxID=3494 RepID=A0AA88J4S5_FICCA|nr:hypothetical protein TIFTF001_031795 [Ficus carica]